jgi:hypothetical protein
MSAMKKSWKDHRLSDISNRWQWSSFSDIPNRWRKFWSFAICQFFWIFHNVGFLLFVNIYLGRNILYKIVNWVWFFACDYTASSGEILYCQGPLPFIVCCYIFHFSRGLGGDDGLLAAICTFILEFGNPWPGLLFLFALCFKYFFHIICSNLCFI